MQQGILKVGLYDLQLIYCAKKVARIKRSGYKEIELCSLKSYAVHGCEKGSSKIKFTSYKNVYMRILYIQNSFKNKKKLIEVIEKETCVKNKIIKQNSREGFDNEISEKLLISGRFYLNKSRFYLKQRYIKQSGIMYKISLQNKKKTF